jgi:ethanolamine permease
VIYVIMLIIFAVYGRHNLVMSPEEEYAIKNSNK